MSRSPLASVALEHRQRCTQLLELSLQELARAAGVFEVRVPVVDCQRLPPFLHLRHLTQAVAPENGFCRAEALRPNHAAPIALDHVEANLAPCWNIGQCASEPLRRCDREQAQLV